MSVENQKPKIAIQGGVGSFHEMQAQLIWPEADLIYCKTFEEVFECLLSGQAVYILTAVLNTLAGKIEVPTRLLKENERRIEVLGKQELQINQNLIVIPGTKIEDIKQIWSQQPALDQCKKFLNEHPWIEPVPKEDTAGSVKDMRKLGDKRIAAIAGVAAATAYKAEVLYPAIQDQPNNYTTFAVACLAMSEQPIIAGGTLKREIQEALLKGVVNFDHPGFEEVRRIRRIRGNIPLSTNPLNALRNGIISVDQIDVLLKKRAEKPMTQATV